PSTAGVTVVKRRHRGRRGHSGLVSSLGEKAMRRACREGGRPAYTPASCAPAEEWPLGPLDGCRKGATFAFGDREGLMFRRPAFGRLWFASARLMPLSCCPSGSVLAAALAAGGCQQRLEVTAVQGS